MIKIIIKHRYKYLHDSTNHFNFIPPMPPICYLYIKMLPPKLVFTKLSHFFLPEQTRRLNFPISLGLKWDHV